MAKKKAKKKVAKKKKVVAKKKTVKKKAAAKSSGGGAGKTATITNVEIHDVFDLWRKKPQQLRFDDTDVLIVTVKTGNKEIKETFFTCLKPDGTFNIKTASKTSQARRQKLASFLKHYFQVEDTKRYNLKDNIKLWKGHKIKLENDYIYIP